MNCQKFKTISIRLALVALAALSASKAVASECTESYTIRPGDTLTGILAHKLQSLHKHKNIYGSDGLLQQILALNPKSIKNPNLIFPHKKLLLPEELASDKECQQEKTDSDSTKTTEEEVKPSTADSAPHNAPPQQAQLKDNAPPQEVSASPKPDVPPPSIPIQSPVPTTAPSRMPAATNSLAPSPGAGEDTPPPAPM